MSKDLTPILGGLSIETKTSKAGKPYQVLQCAFTDNDRTYTVDNFLSQDQLFILETMLSNIQ